MDEFINTRSGVSIPIVGINDPAPSFGITPETINDTPGVPKTVNASENGGVPAEDIFDWNSLVVGQKINGGNVLDATGFKNLFGDLKNSDSFLRQGANGIEFTPGLGSRSFDGTDNSKFGGNFSGRTEIGVYGYQAVDGLDIERERASESGVVDEETFKLKAAELAKQNNLDIANFTKRVPGAFEGSGENYQWNGGRDEIDYAGLRTAINQANYTKLINAPDAIFFVDSTQNTGSDKDRQRTWYTQKEDRLVPLESKGYYQGHNWVDGNRAGVAFVASAVIGGVAAPYISAAAGGGATGAAVAGATIGGTQAALAGGSAKDILKGIALGAAGGAFSSYVSPTISNALGGGTLGNIGAGVAKVGFTSALAGSSSADLGKNVVSAIIKNSGIEGAGILDTLVKYGYETQKKRKG
jgi:hypothetical protein